MAQHQHQPQQPPRPTVSLAIEGMMWCVWSLPAFHCDSTALHCTAPPHHSQTHTYPPTHPHSMKNCGSTVRAALEGVPGVARADVSLEDGGRAVVHLSGPGAASVGVR